MGEVVGIFYGGVFENYMQIIILEGILKRIGVDKKDEKRDEQIKKMICFWKGYHLLSF